MMTMVIAMIIGLLSGMMVIKNGRSRKPKLRENFCPVPGTHQDGGISVCQKMRKKRQKNCGGRPFDMLSLKMY